MSFGAERLISRAYGSRSQNAALFSGVVVWLAGVAAVADPDCVVAAIGATQKLRDSSVGGQGVRAT